jgi:integrase
MSQAADRTVPRRPGCGRGGGEGDVHQRSDGRWEARLDFGIQRGADGRARRVRKSFYGKTRRAVVEQMNQFRADLQTGLATLGHSPLLSDWLSYWLEHVVKPNREPTTYELYEILVRRHIVPFLGDIRLDRLQLEAIEDWLAKLEDVGVGWRTRQSALVRLRTALSVAVQRRRLARNPATDAEPPQQARRPKRPPPSLDDARQLLAALESSPLLKVFALVWLGVGLRRGEALGLRWDDIRFDEGYLLVQRRVSRVRGAGLLVRSGAKSAEGNSALPLPKLVAEALISRRRQQHDDQLRAGLNWKGTADGYVFTTAVGTLIEPRNVNRAFTAALRRAGLEHRTPHGLRHDFAGLLLASGVPSRVAQELMRHTRYELTANVYQQPPDELLRLATAQVDRALGYEDSGT